ncbi:serine--tRNA ligase [Roseivirga pacifica]|uniref:serine--tRNA ligase n=1 Tax=Roseivirga pacifica TaxID=1267423 RepID=UPI002095326D|nr:serine--tRNA ligase [Roseivirga pacifica]MCO6359003.1 serine--tRNA ligase [Roseivirga pacifica]MCO6365361.1 serine--tRNA ligase [Roseivirga pacifica]MCO6371909.1 serine--tRNA ligase [Roseivirga pacifica]MCO6375980.1 serine--tRNA ligase [Roseivirga pacifica]MCO6379287.1 serine--tRNA ligase [Roseivirga pacifica]
MLQVGNIIANKEKYVEGLKKRNLNNAAELLEEVIALDDERKQNQHTLDSNLAEANSLAKQIGGLMKEGKREEAEEVKAKTAELKSLNKSLSEKQNEIEAKLQQALYNIPNIPNETVPTGNSDEDNVEIERHGELPTLHEGAKAHWDLIKDHDIIDFDLGIKITGAGFPVYKGKGARLQRALVNFFLDEATKAGYGEVQPPIVVNEASGYATGQLPDKEGQMYHITNDDLYLIPTAEVPITNLYRNVIVDEKELPVKHVGFTPCFRREAGSWGAHVRGLNRLHQFDKVEIVQIQKPENSYEALKEMCNHVASLLEKLELPYRVLRLCGGDLGFTSALTFDFEVYSAAQEKWLEVSSVSNFETYQANRLKLRYKNDQKKSVLLHTLNGSAMALPRIIAAILENNQDEHGINIPQVLHSYTGFDRI